MRLVPPSGPTNSPPLAIVGEAPGQEEIAAGAPFVGSSGRLLTQMLAAAGVPREQCYLTNVMQTRPPNNKFEAFYDDGVRRRVPSAGLIEGRARLLRELDEVRPKVIIAAGKEALKAIADTEDLRNLRGTMIERYGRRIIPIYHPAYVLRDYSMRPVVECDLRKAYRQARFPSKPVVHINHVPSYSEIISFLAERPEEVSVDIETVDQLTRCIGIGFSRSEAIVIPLTCRSGNLWSESEEIEILIALRDFLSCPHIRKYLQNFPYDTTILERELGLHINNIYLDTMFAHHTMYPELQKSLNFLCSFYTDHHMYWDYDSTDDAETQLYCGYDCLVTFECAKIFEKELRERNLWEFYRTVVHPTVPALTRMQNRGVLIDVEMRDELEVKTLAELKTLKGQIQSTVGFDLNPSSPKQIIDLLYNKWKLPRQIHHKTKKVSTDADSLRVLSRKFPERYEIIRDIVAYREKRTLLGTFIRARLSPTSRIHTSYNVAGTVTGRISSSKTTDGLGGNLQNVPRGQFRRIYHADPGKVFIKADLSQAEYRVLIWKARIRRVIDRWLHEEGFNIHMWNASENIYQIPLDKVTKTHYDNAKNGVYASNYGVGPLKISRMYDMEFRDAKFIIERYHIAVPEIKDVYQAEIREEIQRTRKLTNPFGRERIFFGRMDDQLFREAYSHYCQSTVADLISVGLQELDDLEYELLLQVHDELVLQCWEKDIETTARAVKLALERPMKFEGVEEPLVIPVGIKVGPNWYDMEELDVA